MIVSSVRDRVAALFAVTLAITFVVIVMVAAPIQAAGPPDGGPPSSAADRAFLVLRARLLHPDPIAAVQNSSFPGSIANDRGLCVGSLFSGLFRDPRDPFLTFWGVTDRGPNEELPVGNEMRRTFPLPGFNPAIFRLHVQASDEAPSELKIDETIQVKTAMGSPVSGLPNRQGADEVPYDWKAEKELAYDVDGLDPEGIVRTPEGEFWLCEEYGPSLLAVNPDGTVRMRFVPAGSRITGTNYPVSETLPAVYAKRKANRGFESIAISGDGAKVFTIVQSPIQNPNKATGDASRILRMLVVDRSGQPVAEYVIVAETASSFNEKKQTEMKVSDAAYVNARTLLIDERTDRLARVFSIDFGVATNILGSKWDDVATAPSLEALKPEELAARGIVPAKKSLVADIGELVKDAPQKIEGLAIIDRWTIAVGNDNEFALACFDDMGNRKLKGNQLSELLIIRLSRPLALE